jgi:hypothetical protein
MDGGMLKVMSDKDYSKPAALHYYVDGKKAILGSGIEPLDCINWRLERRKVHPLCSTEGKYPS